MRLLAILIACLISVDIHVQSPDNSTPEKTVQAFITALNAKDVKVMMSLVQNAQDLNNLLGPFLKISGEDNSFGGSEYHTIQSGDEAIVSFLLTDIRPTKSFVAEDLVRLVKTDHGWLLAQPKTDQVTSVAGLSVFALAISRPKALQDAVDLDRRAWCAQNVRQLGLAMIMFSADYDDTMKVPASQAEVRKAIAPYLRNEELWKCPTTGEIAYSFNVNLAGKSFVSVDNPVRTVLMYEGSHGKLDFRHGGIANVCFCDGHVKAVNEEEAKTLLWK